MVLCVLFVAPGAFNVSNVAFVSSKEVNITIEEVSACTYIHSTSAPLSVTHSTSVPLSVTHSTSVPLSITYMSLYVHMQLNVDSGETWSVLP